jgi:D-arabinose 1-dehydrogenase-like Zn-dependent alcohol dehydrogenase
MKGSVLCGDGNASRTANRQRSSHSTRSPSRRWARRRCSSRWKRPRSIPLRLVLDPVGGTPVGALIKSLKTGGAIVVYALRSGQFQAMPPSEFIYRGLSLHGFWLIHWIRNAPRAEIREMYQKLGDLVADGSLWAAVEQVYPLDAFKEAFTQSLKSNRSGKILFTCGAPDGAMPAKAPATTTKPAFR